MIRALCIFVIFYCVECSENGYCMTKDSFGRKRWFCCDNHVLINHTCVECLDGFESFDGSPCKLCENGRYGRKCSDICRCLEHELCNHIKGCVYLSKNMSTETGIQSVTTSSTIYTSIMSISSLLTTTLISDDEKIVDNGSTHSTMIRSSSLGIKTSTTTRSTEKGLHEREIIIYSLSSAVVVLFILLCTVCQQRYMKLYGNLKKYQTENRRRRNIPENTLSGIPLGQIEEIYEVIDESNMLNILENNSVFEVNESYIPNDSNGYLTPYPFVGEDSNDNTSESLAIEDANQQTTTNRESTASSTEVQGRRCSYLNPYQPIDHSEDSHEHISTHIKDDSGSSGSETLMIESGYLNPYQPMVPDRNFHEYKSVLCCSDGSGSSLSNTIVKDFMLPNPYQDLTVRNDMHEYKSVNDIVTCSQTDDDLSTNLYLPHDNTDTNEEI